MKKIITSVFVILFIAGNAPAQKPDADILLKQAIREANSDKDYKKAIRTAQQAKQASPDYVDVRLLLGRLYLLTGDHQQARTELKWVLRKQPENQDALGYLVNLEAAEKNYEQALAYASQSLRYKDTQTMRDKRASIENAMKDEIAENQHNRIGVSYDYTFFDPHYHPWSLVSLYYIRQEPKLTYSAHINYADRGPAAGDGVQLEANAYPLHKNGYSFINLAYGSNDVFPRLRVGYSRYFNVAKGWEAEAGARYQKSAAMHLKSLGGSVGRYWSNYWVNLRPFVTNEGDRFYLSTTLTGRKYFDNKETYLTMILGYGNSPDDPGRDFQFGTRYNVDAYRVSAGFQKLFARSNIIGVLGTYNNQELIPGKRRNEFDVFINYQRKF